MRPSSRSGDGPRSTGRPPWSPTWPTTGWCGSSWRCTRRDAAGRTAAGPLPPWQWPASPPTASIAPSSPPSSANVPTSTSTRRSAPRRAAAFRAGTRWLPSAPRSSWPIRHPRLRPTSVSPGLFAASRVHLRAHHPSDVVGGAALGSVLGLTLRPVLNWVAPGARRRMVRAATRTAKGMGPQRSLLKKL